MTAVARRSVFADRLLEFPDLVFSDGAEFQRRGGWREFFGMRIREGEAPAEPAALAVADDVARREPRPRSSRIFDGRVIFEIGCNDAALLASVAARHPVTAFIGIDWKCRALHTAAQRVTVAGLQNVALLHGRAQDIGRIFGDGELDEAWIFHPEPCDTARELKNRLIAEPFLRDVHRALRDGGSLVLKTDHRGYFESVLQLLGNGNADFDRSVTSFDFWNDPSARSAVAARCFAGEVTGFESRFLRKRKPIYFAEMQRGRSDAIPRP